VLFSHCLHSIDDPGQEGRVYLPGSDFSREFDTETDPAGIVRTAAKTVMNGARRWLVSPCVAGPLMTKVSAMNILGAGWSRSTRGSRTEEIVLISHSQRRLDR